MTMTLLEKYYEWANITEIKVLDWIDPEGGWKVHPMADYPLASFASVFAICSSYLLFVMFDSTSPIQFIYNPIQVIAFSYMFMETAIQAYRNGYSPAPCNAFKADAPVMGNVLYLFYLSKMLDMCDTIFIIVGKKWRQLSFLHVYHHLSVLVIYYIVFRVAQDGDSYASVVLNGFVHTIMYTYYFVSAHTRNERYLTLLQIIQFVTMNVQGYLMYSRECPGMPPMIPLIYLVYVQSLFWLFVNFYSYTRKSIKTMSVEMLQSYYEWANATEVKLLDWVDPQGGWKVHPMADYPLANFASVYIICIGYLLFVIFGTAFMKLGIPAIKTSPFQFVYNPIQVIACSYMCVEAAIQAYRNGYSPAPCNAFKADAPVMGNVLYLFYLSKMLDLCDTVFIILGKKWKQLSILHVYHHLTVLFVYYVTFRAAQDGDSYATIVLNGFVHTIMYTYYFVSAHTRDIWWKKYLTRIQLIQFVTMNVQGYLTYSRQCPGMPPKVPLMYLVYVQSLFWLFMNFYIRAYIFGPKNSPPVVVNAKKQL
ncbi:hypothetical protein DD238_006649 [Peronospora effusa]|uniref:Elongation of fatty acids protein n=1 Tax=Peronospora effusa TaxID=542832 RepID=A0A3M6VIM0_9STRA|nr:hypothetical protein DD238_006649 [Peronospora effusa]